MDDPLTLRLVVEFVAMFFAAIGIGAVVTLLAAIVWAWITNRKKT